MKTPSPFSPVEKVLEHLQGVRRLRGGWLARCPVPEHGKGRGDVHPSLSVAEAPDGRVLLRCHAGCPTESIVGALGLALRDLFPDGAEGEQPRTARRFLSLAEYGAAKKLPVEFLRRLGLRDAPRGVRIPYLNRDGEEVNARIRHSLGGARFSWERKGKGQIAYGEWLLGEASQRGFLILVEGESDAQTLWLHGYPALGVPGASGFDRAMAEAVRGVPRLYACREPDQGGERFIQQVARRLQEVGFAGELYLLSLPAKDPSALYLEDPDRFRGRFDEALHQAIRLDVRQVGPQVAHVREPILVRLSDVKPEPVGWLWEPYIPLGKLTILEGDPGVGKTWLAITLAATVSCGGPFPGPEGVPCERREPAPVVYLAAEEGLADTLRPRLDSAGADVSRVFSLSGWQAGEKSGVVTLQDLDVLERALERVRPALVVVDPLQAYLGPTVDMHRANETRPILAGLASLAEGFDCAMLVVRHLTKVPSDRAVYRGLGSIDIAAAARSILLVGYDPDDETKVRRAMVHVKSSLAPAGPSLAFELRAGRLFWVGVSEARPADLLAVRDEVDTERRKLPQAVEWLRGVLSEGPVPSRELEERAEVELGISRRTLWRAAREAGVHTRREGRRWVWDLPTDSGVSCVPKFSLAHMRRMPESLTVQGFESGVPGVPKKTLAHLNLDPLVEYALKVFDGELVEYKNSNPRRPIQNQIKLELDAPQDRGAGGRRSEDIGQQSDVRQDEEGEGPDA